jgi:DNA-directed RNA polymerase specialized sigma24 family protein
MIRPAPSSNGHAGPSPRRSGSQASAAQAGQPRHDHFRGRQNPHASTLAGDEPAFEEFFAAYFPRLFRFALPRVGGDEDAAEEATQAALVKAIEKLHTYRGEAALFTWLCAICRNEIVTIQRRTHREPASSFQPRRSLRPLR